MCYARFDTEHFVKKKKKETLEGKTRGEEFHHRAAKPRAGAGPALSPHRDAAVS
jgi:hypothetical protein